MSLLSKLLGGKKPTLSEVVDLLQGKEQKPAARPAQSYQPSPVSQTPEPMGEPTPIGRSWGERMPDEPNQYNYPGSWRDYFQDIFNREFAAYRVVPGSNSRSPRTASFRFYSGERQVLVVELASQHSDLYALRRSCARSNTPYMRFYYDHPGWWNARSYVVQRIRDALA